MRNISLFEDKVENVMNSTDLEYIKILGLFGRHNVELFFDKEVNIYIGENGLGKTTILNCVYFILKKQYLKLADIDFAEIQIKFKSEVKEKSLKLADINEYNLRRMPRRGYDPDYFEYMLQDMLQDMIISPSHIENMDNDDFDMLARRLSNTVGVPIPMARRQIQQYLRTNLLVHEKKNRGEVKKVEELNALIDKKITQKILYFTTYRRIEDDFSKLINNEEKMRQSSDTLIRFGMSDVDKTIKMMLEKIRENSRESFNKMTGVLLKQYSDANKQIDNKFDKASIDKDMLKIILDRLGNEVEQEDRDNIILLLDNQDIYKLEYSYLLDLILKLIDNYNKQKVLDEKIKNFVYTCNKYLNGKQFVYNQSELTLLVCLQNDEGSFDNTIELTNLSSGEKQIVSLFSKLYLENELDSILVIDEPELSLSMEWQKMLLPDIMRSGNCKLLLTVTHSPFIFTNEFDYDAKEMRTCITDAIRG